MRTAFLIIVVLFAMSLNAYWQNEEELERRTIAAEKLAEKRCIPTNKRQTGVTIWKDGSLVCEIWQDYRSYGSQPKLIMEIEK